MSIVDVNTQDPLCNLGNDSLVRVPTKFRIRNVPIGSVVTTKHFDKKYVDRFTHDLAKHIGKPLLFEPVRIHLKWWNCREINATCHESWLEQVS